MFRYIFQALSVFALIFAGVFWPAQAADPAKPIKFTIEFSSYRGYWRLDDAVGNEIAHDECFTQRSCREVFRTLPAGDYALVLSKEPQSAPLKFTLSPTGLVVRSGETLLSPAPNMTLRLSGLRRVLFNLDDYRGAWSLANWDGAEATGFFRRDGGEQAIELVPNTTYAFQIGPMVVERFQVDANERVTLIDDRGALKLSSDAKNKLVLSTIPVAVYPEPTPEPLLWSMAGLPPADGRPGYKGPMVLRLAQGSTYQLSLNGSPASDKPSEFKTGKGCNMQPRTLKLGAATLHVAPVTAACRN